MICLSIIIVVLTRCTTGDKENRSLIQLLVLFLICSFHQLLIFFVGDLLNVKLLDMHSINQFTEIQS